MIPRARFQDISNKVVTGVDKLMAEPVRYFPMIDGHADESRKQINFEAVLRVNSSRLQGPDKSGGLSWRSRYPTGKGQLFINRATEIYFDIRKNDKIQPLSMKEEIFYLVSFVDLRNQFRIILDLTEA